jgi:hypothetical protein
MLPDQDHDHITRRWKTNKRLREIKAALDYIGGALWAIVAVLFFLAVALVALSVSAHQWLAFLSKKN